MRSSHYRYVDALRGYAILGVIATHATNEAPAWDGFGRLLASLGARGVQLFFVASALTLLMSWYRRKDGLLPFYIRRLFRIAPMFWLGIIVFVLLEGLGPRSEAPNGIGPRHIILTALFLHGWQPDTINSVVPGGWSIAVEMAFYLIFPALVYAIRGWRSASVAFVSAVAFAAGLEGYLWTVRQHLWPGADDILIKTFLSFWLPNQLPVFLVGFITYFAIRDGKGRIPRWSVQCLLTGSILAMVALVVLLDRIMVAGYSLRLFSYSLYGMCFGAVAFALSEGAGGILVNTAICFIGKISFSAYLIHFGIIQIGLGVSVIKSLLPPSGADGPLFFCIYFPFLVAVTVAASAVTYRVIERPTMALGGRLATALSSPAIPAAALVFADLNAKNARELNGNE